MRLPPRRKRSDMANPDPPEDAGVDQAVHHVSERLKRGRPKPKLQPPLTPMIDVTFQLLLFFILTMQFRQAEGQIPADLPVEQGEKAKVTTPLEPITVYLRPSPGDPEAVEIEISRYSTVIQGWQHLYSVLVELQKDFDSSDVPVVIKPTGKTLWSHALNAFNQGRRARFENVAFAKRGGGG